MTDFLINRTFEELCRLYRDPRLPSYQKAFLRASQSHPFLPSVADLFARLLDRDQFPTDMCNTLERLEYKGMHSHKQQ